MPATFSNDFLNTLNRWLNRSKNPELIREEVSDNVEAIEGGPPRGDEPSQYHPGLIIHVCKGARFGIVYSIDGGEIFIQHLERISM